LKNGKIDKATSVEEFEWDTQLKWLGLSMGLGAFHKSLLWGTLKSVTAHVGELANSYSHRVSTAGSVGTDRDGEGHDSNARDRRAKQWFAEQQDKEPLTQATDLWSGETIYDRAGTNFNTNTRNKQTFWEAWKAGLEEKILRVGLIWSVKQGNNSLLQLWRDIEKNRS
jgi:hypothetical protein